MPMNRRILRPVNPRIWPTLLLILLFAASPIQAADSVTPLTATEARILIYISPVGQELRARGLDIAMERQTSPQLNQGDYYYFWAYDAKRHQSSGSVTIGYYAVNKHTGQVWDTDRRVEVSSRLLQGVQRIIRESHHVDQATMERYSGKRF